MYSDSLGFGAPRPHVNLEFSICLGLSVFEKTGMRETVFRHALAAKAAERARLEELKRIKEKKESERTEEEKEDGKEQDPIPSIRGDGCLLETSMGAKALLGTMFRESGKSPLYRVSAVYVSAPTEELFGKGVKISTLSDKSLASCLDELYLMDMKKVLVECYRKLKEFYGFGSVILHLDHTDYFLWGDCYEDEGDGAAIPMFSGHEKSNMNNNLQKNISAICDGAGIPIMTVSFDGNTSDVTMNKSMIDHLKDNIGDISDYIVVGDCKLATASVIRIIEEKGAGFITKVPVLFNDSMKARVLERFRESDMRPVDGHEGMTAVEMEDSMAISKEKTIPLRVVVFRHAGALDAARHAQINKIDRAKQAFEELTKRPYSTMEDLRGSVRKLIERYKGLIDIESYTHMTLFTDEKPAFLLMGGKIIVDYIRAEELAHLESLTVLVSNVDRKDVDDADPRKGISTATLIRYYLEEDRVEKNFSMLKSGEKVNHMFIETLKRQDAVVFIATLGTMISMTVNTVMKTKNVKSHLPSVKNGVVTMKFISDFMARTSIEYDDGRISIGTYPESQRTVIDIMNALQLEAADLF